MDAFDSPGLRASALDAIITLDASGRVVEWNPAAEHIFGYTRDQAIGALLSDLISPPEPGRTMKQRSGASWKPANQPFLDATPTSRLSDQTACGFASKQPSS